MFTGPKPECNMILESNKEHALVHFSFSSIRRCTKLYIALRLRNPSKYGLMTHHSGEKFFYVIYPLSMQFSQILVIYHGRNSNVTYCLLNNRTFFIDFFLDRVYRHLVSNVWDASGTSG